METAIEVQKQQMEIDKVLLKQRFESATNSYDAHATVQQSMACKLVELSRKYLPGDQLKVLEIGCGTGLLTRQIIRNFHISDYVVNDLVDNVKHNIETILKNKVDHPSFIAGDAELQMFPGLMSSIWSGATIQWVTDLTAFFARMSALLIPNGFMVLSSFGPNNYAEIKAITGRGIDYPSNDQVIHFASDHFELVTMHEWQEQLWFKSPREILMHMRNTGVNGVSRCGWNKGSLKNFTDAYHQFAQFDRFPMTYHPYLMIFKKK